MGSYIPSTKKERQGMLETIGLRTMDDLYADVPASVQLKRLPDAPDGLSELEVVQKMTAMAERNHVFKTILRGAGAYDHYIPAIVDSVTSKEEFSTTYTPYQAEISQGVLQSIFEYQTMICELTGMDVSNASVYDGASAAAEAVMMCVDRKRTKVFSAASVHPDVLATIKTYCWAKDLELHLIPEADGLVDMDALKEALTKETACVYIQQPNFLGLIENASAIGQAVHGAGAKFIMGVNPISLGIMHSPRESGADIAVGEGQPLGLPLSFGGPYLGFMATTKAMMRMMPGRIVGQTRDSRGQRAFVLTLQAREQHIRREKASSNICSNQALCAMRASVYLVAVGPQGLRKAAQLCYSKAHYLAEELCKLPGFKLIYDGAFFNEFVTTLPVPAEKIEKALMNRDILAGLPVNEGMLWCVTEKVSKEKLDETVQTIRGVYTK
ncbi:MAG: aminomethyl-transferring glycine dehydrogenase subunit GcvPA [Eubacteriales bacterium]|nr:aminomethyl-transferring glycine dehydrogenase subunit GcvPA [Eubacteriales bacterium]MDD4104941.1 aminomethyl-transferring glycine dehydrogenase subunit GcvPA [Eubacteriales bacterium]MDD4710452.1 aminomethyl-transferring glycine dehydrogenase subunit GcvPA [Eubacteriales bacterium]